MQRIEIHEGGHPYGNEDLTRVQSLALEGFKMLVEGRLQNGEDACIISGCKFTTSLGPVSTSVTQGYIYLKGKIYFVPPVTVNNDINNCSFVADTDVIENVLYNDGNQRDVCVTKRLVLTTGVNDYDGAGGGAYRPIDFYYLENSAPSGTIRHFLPPSGKQVNDYVDTSTGVGKDIFLGWTLFSQGRVLAGFKGDLADYNTIGNEFGENTHLLSANESGLPAHSHSINDPGHTHSMPFGQFLTTRDGSNPPGVPDDQGPSNTSSSSTGITINESTPRNATQPHENRQPTKVVLIFIKN